MESSLFQRTAITFILQLPYCDFFFAVFATENIYLKNAMLFESGE